MSPSDSSARQTIEVSREIKTEIERRIADGIYASADDLIRRGLESLEKEAHAYQAWLETELLKGLEGDASEFTHADFEQMKRELEAEQNAEQHTRA